MASGWNLWAWLQCRGVASRCCCKEIKTEKTFKNEHRSMDAAAKKRPNTSGVGKM